MKNKNIKALISQIALLIVFTFLGGFFVPQKFLEDKLSILGLLIAIWGVAITLFVFVQGVVQSCKSNLLNSNNSKDYVVEKYSKIDRIIRELTQDIKCISIMLAVYFVFIIFAAFDASVGGDDGKSVHDVGHGDVQRCRYCIVIN